MKEVVYYEIFDKAKALVWGVRSEIRQQWATPDQLNSTRFACTEAGEAQKAMVATALALAWENTWAQTGLSLNQAFVYATEALDGMLRTKQGFSRNRDKVIDIANELADCAMMLITALGPTWQPFTHLLLPPDKGPQPTLEVICQQVAAASNSCRVKPEQDFWKMGAEAALASIYLYCPQAIHSVLAERLERIAIKHTGRPSQTLLDASTPASKRAKKAVAA